MVERCNGFGEQVVREERRAGNLGLAICYAVQEGLESPRVMLEEALVVDVHAFGRDVLVGDFIPPTRGYEWFSDTGGSTEWLEHPGLIE